MNEVKRYKSKIMQLVMDNKAKEADKKEVKDEEK